MALILLGGNVSEIRGSIGSHTYSRNRFGAYIRSRTVPTNPSTPAQSAIRTIMAQVVAAWHNLEQIDRDEWGDYAASIPWTNKLGQQVYLSGQNHFVRYNVARLAMYPMLSEGKQAAWGVTDTAPDPGVLPPQQLIDAATFTVATEAFSLDASQLGNWAGSDAGYALIYAGRCISPSRPYYGGPYALVDVLEGVALTPLESPLVPDFTALNPSAGQVIPMGIRVMIDGVGLSQMATFRADIVAGV